MPKTSELSAASTLDGTETWPGVQGGTSKKMTSGALVRNDGTITKVVALTQAAYDALTPVSTTLYVIVAA